MSEVTKLFEKFHRIFNKKLSDQVDEICFDANENQINDEFGYGYVKDHENNIGLYIFYMGKEKLEESQLKEVELFNDPRVEFVYFIINGDGENIANEMLEQPANFYINVNHLWGSKNKTLLDVQRIWKYDELISKLYHNIKVKINQIDEFPCNESGEKMSYNEGDVDLEGDGNQTIQEPNIQNDPFLFYQQLSETVDKWNKEILNTSSEKPLTLIGLKKNPDVDQLTTQWKEWYDYFVTSTWKDVFILYDKELHTGTIILFGNDNKINLKGSIAKDVSWALFQVLSFLSTQKENQIQLHSLSCIVIDEFTEDKPDDPKYKGNIISGLEQRSDLLHEIKITLINKNEWSFKSDFSWITDYLANHLIPFRKSDTINLKKLQEDVWEFREKWQEKLKDLLVMVDRNKMKWDDDDLRAILSKIASIVKGLLSKPTEFSPDRVEAIHTIFMGIKLFTEKPVLLNLKEKINVIFAPNGYGKSSIVDGIKYAILENQKKDYSPLWNVWHEEPGIFGFVTKRNNEFLHRTIFQEQDQPYKKECYVVKEKDDHQYIQCDNRILNIRMDQLKTFCFSGETETDFNNSMLNILISKLMNFDWAEFEEVQHFMSASNMTNEHAVFRKFKETIINIQKEVGEIIKKKLIQPLLTTFAKIMTSESWLYTFKFHFSSQEGLKMGGEGKDGTFDINQIINMGEQKVINLAVFFLLYYLEGYRYSKVIILDDIFATFDEKQCYNFLRFLMIFSNLPRVKDCQFIILSHRKPIFDYFYYNTLTYLNKNSDKDVAGYYNFVLKEEKKDSIEKYKKYMEKLQGSEEENERKLYEIYGK